MLLQTAFLFSQAPSPLPFGRSPICRRVSDGVDPAIARPPTPSSFQTVVFSESCRNGVLQRCVISHHVSSAYSTPIAHQIGLRQRDDLRPLGPAFQRRERTRTPQAALAQQHAPSAAFTASGKYIHIESHAELRRKRRPARRAMKSKSCLTPYEHPRGTMEGTIALHQSRRLAGCALLPGNTRRHPLPREPTDRRRRDI